MPTTTTNYGLYKPLVNDATDEDLWGGYQNDSMDLVDTQMKVLADAIAASTAGQLPVGSYYMNEDVATNPSTLLGYGTWVAVSDKFIVARGGTYTGTGGAASVTLAQNNLPASLSFTSTCTESDPSEGAGTTKIAKGDVSGSSVTATLAFTNSGGGQSFSIIPTYQAAYIWKRTV